LIKNSQPFGKNFQKTVRGIFLTHTVDQMDFSMSVVRWPEQVKFLMASHPIQRHRI